MRLLLRFAFYALSVTFLAGCRNAEVGNVKDVVADAIYFDYKIWGEEGKEDVTVLIQYKFGGKDGTTLVLEEPSKVELDGEKLKGDSAGFTGAYYEVQKPLSNFKGKHTIVFTDYNNNQFKEEFNFLPFTLATELPPTLSRKHFQIQLEGLLNKDELRVIVTDTSFESRDINELITVNNGTLNISQNLLRNVENGPVTLDIYKETEREINATKEGGFISITYGLKRELTLED